MTTTLDRDSLKVELKTWEAHFQKENGRKPTMTDIDSNLQMKQKYKLYRDLCKKSSKADIAGASRPVIEKTEAESTALPVSTQTNKQQRKSRFKDPLNLTPKRHSNINLSVAEPIPINRGIFGAHLNKSFLRQSSLVYDQENLDIVDQEIVVDSSKIMREYRRETKIITEKTVTSNSIVAPIQTTPLKQAQNLSLAEIVSPMYRAGQSLGLEKKVQFEDLISPRKELALMTPARRVAFQKTQEQNIESQGDNEENLEQNEIDGVDSESVEEAHEYKGKKKWKFKRQTSKRKLVPVSYNTEMPNPETRKRAKQSAAGPVLKLNRRGKKLKFINHGRVLDQKPLNESYGNSNEVVDNDDENLFLDDQDEISGQDSEFESVQERVHPANAGSSELFEILRDVFGHQSFRLGQKDCIERVMQGMATALVLPTGYGKSLCYQLPAFEFAKNGLMSIMIAPTVSLMEDQIKSLNPSIRGSLLNSFQNSKEVRNVIRAMKNSEVDLLLVSAEKFVSRSFLSLIKSPEMPKIGLVCIDEAHCMSEWSHNFRPAYLQIPKFLKQLHPRSLLALTATAPPVTMQSIRESLDIKMDNVLQPIIFEKRFNISISRPEKKLNALLELVRSDPFKNCESLVVYCMKQKDTEYLASNLKDIGFEAAAYHGGLPRDQRNSIQKRFMQNKLRIICATLAFGLGIDKADIRGVIHYTMPKSIENYVQEIGRAGRDGGKAYCHLFLNDDDYFRLRSFAYTDFVESIMLKKFVERIFKNDTENIIYQKDSLYDYESLRCFEILALEMELDMRRPVLATLAHHCSKLGNIDTLPNIHIQYKIILNSEKSKSSIDSVTQLSKLAEIWISEGSQKTVSTLDACKTLKLSPYELHERLFELAETHDFMVLPEKEAFSFGFGRETPTSIDQVNIWKSLCKISENITTENVAKVDAAYSIFSSFIDDPISSDNINTLLEEYFTSDKRMIKTNGIITSTFNRLKTALKQDIRVFISDFESRITSGTCIARIFHGLPSPKFPQEEWNRSRFWSKYHSADFLECVKMAREELLEYMSSIDK